MYNVDERIELDQKKNENKTERFYLHNHIQKKAVSIEIDHTALESLNQKERSSGRSIVFKCNSPYDPFLQQKYWIDMSFIGKTPH